MKAARFPLLLAFLFAATYCGDSPSTGLDEDDEENPPEEIDEENFSPAVDLGSLPGATVMEPWAISRHGEIVGQAQIEGVGVRVFYYGNGKLEDLGEGIATDISDNGRIVGARLQPAVVWQKTGENWTHTELPGDATQNLKAEGNALAINRAGNRVVGFAVSRDQSQAVSKATLWVESSGRWAVTALPSSSYMSEAHAVSEYVIAGVNKGEHGTSSAVAWIDDGQQWKMQELPVPQGTVSSTAVAMNAGGEIAGAITDAAGKSKAVCWIPAPGTWNQPDLLGHLGGEISVASDINDYSEIVGVATTLDGDQHGYVWTPASGMTDLRGIAGRTSAASAINRGGDIAGSGKSFTRLVMWPPAARSN